MQTKLDLVEYCEAVSRATGVPIPANYPIVGRDAFRTATGVHAAALMKALRRSRPTPVPRTPAAT